jgi:peptidoglycan/xylan/chitin deacetylase (PgdA/CDA1 family)
MILHGTPVLTYHGLACEQQPGISLRERKYWVPPVRFREQLAVLGQEHYECMTLSRFWVTPRAAASRKSVVLTFDDGRISDYEIAFPALMEAELPATFFVNTASVGAPGHVTWPQIREMSQAGMSFQSHSHHHLYLSALPIPELRYQLEYSKRMLEDQLGAVVQFLAVPYGDTNKVVLRTALGLGYSAMCASHNWPAQPESLSVNRIVVYGTTTEREFQRLVNRDPFFYWRRAIRTGLLYLPKELLRASRKIRARVAQDVSV